MAKETGKLAKRKKSSEDLTYMGMESDAKPSTARDHHRKDRQETSDDEIVDRKKRVKDRCSRSRDTPKQVEKKYTIEDESEQDLTITEEDSNDPKPAKKPLEDKKKRGNEPESKVKKRRVIEETESEEVKNKPKRPVLESEEETPRKKKPQ